MRRLFLLSVSLLAGLGAATTACGDDDGGGDPADAGSDVAADSPIGTDATTDSPSGTDGGIDAAGQDAGADANVAPPPGGPCKPALNGLVAWWSGDGTMVDLAPTPANVANADPVAFSVGKVGGAFDLDESFVEIADTAKLDLAGPLTLEAWIYLESLPPNGGSYRVIDKITAGGADGYMLDLVTDNAGVTRLRLQLGATPVSSNVAVTTVDRWMHVAGTFDGTTSRLYIDGVERGSGAATAPPTNNLPLRIGADSTGAANELNGLADEIMIHNRALTLAEIQDTIAFGRCKAAACIASTGAGTAPIAWWTGDGVPFDRIGGHHGAEVGDFDYSTGRVLGAFDLRIAGAYLEVDDDDALDFTTATPFSIEAWVNVQGAVSAASKRIVDKITAGGSDGYLLDISGQKVRLVAGNKTVSGLTNVTGDAWHHVAGVWDGTNLRVYLDGVQDNTLAEAPTLAANALPLRIGAQQAGGGSQFTGFIDEVVLYRRARSAAEIQAAFTANANGYCRQTGCTPSGKNIRGWWAGENDLVDRIAGRNGTAAGALAYASGAVGNGFLFAGTSHFTVPSATALEPASLTLEAWVYPTSAAGGTIVEKLAGTSGYSFALTPAGQLSFVVGDGNGAATTATSTGGAQGTLTVPQNKWSHVAVHFDDAANVVRFYLNGVELGETLNVTKSIAANAGVFAVGANSAGAARFPGRMDEVAIYGVPLSEEQIAEIAAAGSGGRCKQ